MAKARASRFSQASLYYKEDAQEPSNQASAASSKPGIVLMKHCSKRLLPSNGTIVDSTGASSEFGPEISS